MTTELLDTTYPPDLLAMAPYGVGGVAVDLADAMVALQAQLNARAAEDVRRQLAVLRDESCNPDLIPE